MRTVRFLVVEGEVLEEGVHALGLGALDLLGDLLAGQDRVLREVLEVTARVGVAVRVRGRRVPARDLHIVRHRTDRLTEGTRELLVEGGRNGHRGGQADRADAREVVVQRGGAVHVGDAQLADRGDRRGAVATLGDEGVHFLDGELVEELIPLRVVVIEARKVTQDEAVLRTRGGHRGAAVSVGGCCVVVRRREELRLVGLAHLEVRGSRGCLREVGEAARTRQVGDITLRVVELVGGHDLVTVVCVVGGVEGLRRIDRVCLLIDDVVRVGARGDHVVASLKHVGLRIDRVVGGERIAVPGDRQRLGLTGLQQLRLLVRQQVRGSLFDATVRVGRVVVDLDDVLTGDLAGVRDGHVRGHGSRGLVDRDVAHRLGERRVGQAVAEGVDDLVTVVDDALSGGRLVPAVADVDRVVVVDEGRLCLGALVEGVVLGELRHVRVLEVAEVVGRGARLDDTRERVGGLRRGVDLAVQDAAQRVESNLAAGDCPHDRVDLRVVLKVAELEDVGSVDDDDRLRRGLLRQLDHVLLGTRQLEVALAIFEVRVVLGVVRVAEVRVVIHLLVDVAGQVETLSARAGDRHDRGVTEGGGVGEQVVRVLILCGLRQRPVGLEHAYLGALSTVGGVQVRQLIVRGEASVVQAVEQRCRRVVLRQRAGAGAAVDRVRRAPTPHVDRGALSERQGTSLVLQQDHALVRNVVAQVLNLGLRRVREGAGASRQVEHRLETAVHHRHDSNDNGDERRDPGRRARELTGRLAHLENSKGDDDGERQRHADDDQGDLDRLNHLPHIRPVDGKHC